MAPRGHLEACHFIGVKYLPVNCSLFASSIRTLGGPEVRYGSLRPEGTSMIRRQGCLRDQPGLGEGLGPRSGELIGPMQDIQLPIPCGRHGCTLFPSLHVAGPATRGQ